MVVGFCSDSSWLKWGWCETGVFEECAECIFNKNKFQWKTSFNEKQVSMKKKFQWKSSFNEKQVSMKNKFIFTSQSINISIYENSSWLVYELYPKVIIGEFN